MVKQYAHKRTRELLTEPEMRENKRNTGEFTGNWQGRIFIIDPKKSFIAVQMGFAKKGEYAIKVR